MPPPYPVLLFTGQRIIDEAHQITGKVVDRISHATLASLTAKPVDDIVQALYNEHYIHLPVLDRNGAEREEFEFFYAPYLTMIHNIDFKTLTDQRRGTIFALDVPFTGEARYLRTRPTAIALKPPLGFIGENKVTLYVPKENHSLEGVQGAFDAILDNIDEHLKRSAESLSAWPMNFRGMVINAIDKRINQLKSTAQISAGLTFKPKRRPNAPDLTVLPVRKQIRPEPFNFQLPAEQQFYLAEEIYQHVLSVMQNMSLVMEYSPKAFADLGEEALRFHFLVQLNGQYEGEATGETFNGEGKSDIIIRQGGANVFIAECKIWEGVTAFSAAIDQLQRYVTWRDTKTALVIFNRNKGFSDVVQKAQEAVRAHPQYKSGPLVQGPARFRYVFRNANDPNREYALTLMLFNVPKPDDANG
jgi:hypothetical protein